MDSFSNTAHRHNPLFIKIIFSKIPLSAILIASGSVFASDSATEALASGCAGCHGAEGKGYRSIPDIAVLSSEDFLRAMQDFESGRRAGTVMNRIAKGFSADEMAALSRHFAGKRQP